MISRRCFLKICAGALLTINGLGFWKLAFSSGPVSYSIPVLLYHRVGYSDGPLTVKPERFTNDLKMLREKGYYGISLDTFQKFIEGELQELPGFPLLITFDDGYRDNYEHAYPILREQRMTASFFIITNMLWTQGRLGVSEIQEMAQRGMSFGSHTASHRPLGKIPESEVYDELNNSKTILENILGRDIWAVAYPNGSYNSAVLKTAQKVGYKMGFSIHEGVCRREIAPLELYRIPMFSYDDGAVSVLARYISRV